MSQFKEARPNTDPPTPLKGTRDIFPFTTTHHVLNRHFFPPISYIIIMVIPQTCAQRQDGPLKNVKRAKYHETLTDIESSLFIFCYYLFIHFLMP